jgi:SAM-dependent methyltransferase
MRRLLSDILVREELVREIEPGIYSAYPPGEGVNSFDKGGAFAYYDAVACNPLYNWLVWGYRTSLYQALCREIHEVAGDGPRLDAGCGSLAFTAEVYAAREIGPTVLLDQSLTLLRKAKARLSRLCGRIPEQVVLLHADAQRTPFKDGVFAAVIALNLLHVFPDPGAFLREAARVSAQGAPMAFTTLVLARRLADRYLLFWGKTGELTPRTPSELLQIMAERNLAARSETVGNLAVLRVDKTRS